ncbi:cadherin-2-like [Lethenteron reissneri]|uniref:cadherin-2-like n=1 Tax=Lethenteron reissneri TaxID=7753 RepID=UPI002AB6E199|nr:cadherin-2-like [Lethenteron reissneri]
MLAHQTKGAAVSRGSPSYSSFNMERWLIIAIGVLENDPGPFPKQLVQVNGHAVDKNGHAVDNDVHLLINVQDLNDNRPHFEMPVIQGSVDEGSLPGTPVMTVTASDEDDALSPNGVNRYKIVSQVPTKSLDRVLTINNTMGVISTIAAGLDHETTPQYVLVVQASDMEGDPDIGLTNTATAIVTIADINDNPPEFTDITVRTTPPHDVSVVGLEGRRGQVSPQP